MQQEKIGPEHSTRRRDPGLKARRWLPALLLLVLPLGVFAQDTPEAAEKTIRYRVQVDAPRALAETLRNTLDIVRWQDYEDTTALVLDRLMREAKDQATEAAEAEGYFKAAVEVTLGPAEANGRRVVHVKVTPGEPVRITDVSIDVNGPAATDKQYGAPAIASLHDTWSLRKGERFRQTEWDDAKRRAVTTLASSPYAAARITKSEALIDPDALSAALTVDIDSGPFFRFGELQVEGLQDYDVSLVRNFSTIARGEPYTTERLDQYVRRLQASGYFASVQARIEPDPAHAEAAPVRVSVIEAPRHRIEGGVGYATDSSYSSNFKYNDFNVDGRATQLEVTGRLDVKIQNLGFVFTRPPTASGYIDSLRGQVEHTDISGLDTRTGLLGVHRQTLEERDRTGYALTYYEDDQRAGDQPRIRSRALYADYERTWRNVDALIAPTKGWVLNTEVGAAPLATRVFGRVIAQSAWWVPVGLDNALLFRLEAGAVLASSRQGIPSALLFRTGGDTTVRAYAFQSLGVQQDGVTYGGRYYAVGSAEATHYFNERLGMAVFVDAGNAGDNLASLHPAFGYGTGLRVKSPVGPFRFDVAYGQESHQVRLHMSVGIAF
ncbi:MAG TPA: autotransporter assembly complex family protein [Burkholderiales bacterium]|nr:autotransporter assembly complex family protein [Burkholderiales bacterium]